MEHHPTWLGNLFNWLFSGLAGGIMDVVGIHPHDAARPIPDYLASEITIFLGCIIFFLWFRNKLSVDNPHGMQLIFEKFLANPMKIGIYDLLDENVGHGGRAHLSVIGSIALFVLLSNLISLIPNTLSPTAVHIVPFGCAVVVFIYYNFSGIRAHGILGYLKHFIGAALESPWWLWPIMIPLLVIVEIISHFARLLSLTVRLWVNMVVSETLYVVFLGIGVGAVAALGLAASPIPMIIPLAFVVLHVFVAFLQAFVFTLLPIVYVGGAVTEEH